MPDFGQGREQASQNLYGIEWKNIFKVRLSGLTFLTLVEPGYLT